jgi:ABC-2 type transport system permease protein
MNAGTRVSPTLLEGRRVPPLGGFNLTFLYLEVRRLVRNRRTVIFTLVIPVVFFVLFTGAADRGRLQELGGPLLPAITMIGVAVYGAMTAATSGGALVSVERALGWSRQLRLTPLRPPAYIVIKLLTAMILGLASVVVVFVVGAIDGIHMPVQTWFLSGTLAWVAALVFAAFGLFMGYLLPSENVMQIIGPVLGVFGFFGGLFVPVTILPTSIQNLAPYMPPYGVAQIARYPLVGGSFDWTWVLSVLLWTIGFAIGAVLLFTRDTRRT